MELIEIKSDVFCIVERLKNWNNKYRLFYNIKNNKYVLYSVENDLKQKEYCLTFPFNTIDERMLDFTQRSEVQNQKKLFEEIERANNLLLKNEQKKLLNEMEKNCESKRCN